MNTLNFNDADLKANREGRLSDAQMKRFDAEADLLRGQRKYSFWAGVTVFACAAIIMMIIVGLMSGSVAVGYAFKDQDLVRLSSTLNMGLVLMIVIFLVSFLIFLLHMIEYNLKIRSLTRTSVHAVEGTAETLYSSLANSVEAITLGNRLVLRMSNRSSMTFKFDTVESLRYFKSGTRYRVYYLPYAMPQALSAEEIEPEKAKR